MSRLQVLWFVMQLIGYTILWSFFFTDAKSVGYGLLGAAGVTLILFLTRRFDTVDILFALLLNLVPFIVASGVNSL